MTTEERCAWCNGARYAAALRGEGPHATWCVHFREEQRGGSDGDRAIARQILAADALEQAASDVRDPDAHGLWTGDAYKIIKRMEELGWAVVPIERANAAARGALSAAEAELRRAKLAVTEWVDEQSRNLRLVTNSMAPGWAAYEAARKRYDEALIVAAATPT